jgi:hypothetical protein
MLNLGHLMPFEMGIASIFTTTCRPDQFLSTGFLLECSLIFLYAAFSKSPDMEGYPLSGNKPLTNHLSLIRLILFKVVNHLHNPQFNIRESFYDDFPDNRIIHPEIMVADFISDLGHVAPR